MGQPLLIVFLGSGSPGPPLSVMDRFLGLKLPFYGIINSFFYFHILQIRLTRRRAESVAEAHRWRPSSAVPVRLMQQQDDPVWIHLQPHLALLWVTFCIFFFRFIMERPDASRTSFNIWWVSSRPNCWAARCTHIVLCEHSSFSWYEQGGGSCFVLLSLSYRQPKRRVGFYLPIAKIVFVVVRVRSFLYFFLCLYYRWKWWKSLG